MKKKILIVSNSLNCGGIQKSLLSLLATFNYNLHDVELLLLKREGIWLESIPSQVKLLDSPDYLNYTNLTKKTLEYAFKNLFKKNGFFLFVNVFLSILRGILKKNMGKERQYFWMRTQKKYSNHLQKYDTAIAFSGGQGAYFIIDKVNADNKVLWVHSDYRVYQRDTNCDSIYYSQFNYIFAVSEVCKQIFCDNFNNLCNRTNVMNNIISKKTIYELSNQSNVFSRIGNFKIMLISVGRLDPEKGYDLSLLVCKRLVEAGYDFKWYIIGDGIERRNLEKKILELNLKNHFIILGMKENPYPFIKAADIFVHSSKFEGKSVAIDEAKILAKPIVSTNFTTIKDQLQDGINGLVVPITVDGIYDGIVRLMESQELRNKLSEDLLKNFKSNEDEIKKLYNAIQQAG